MSTYYELLGQEQKAAKKAAEAYEAERMARARQQASQTDIGYQQLRNAYRQQAQTAAQETETAYAQMYDANAVDELVARRRAAEAIANSNLVNSGLNATQQTAISLQRMRADASTTASRQAALERVMQALDEREASLSRQAFADREEVYRQAEADILTQRDSLERRARENADTRYQAEGTKAIVYADGGTIHADMTYTPSYVTISTNAKMRQRNYGNESATDYLQNAFVEGYLSFEQWKTLHERLDIVPCEGYSYGLIRSVLREAAKQHGEKEARLFVEYLHGLKVISDKEAEQLMQELYSLE